MSLCLLILSGCGSAPLSPAATPLLLGCPMLTPCQLPASNPQSNGQLNDDVDLLERAWAQCAAQVDMTINCQRERQHVKA
ncbi:Rz1-like lysis system protein LysC [Yersinia aldovae]|uniref:Rz1-like lysis system protein LysC n=1 Tax=Yersinia aldovae TaxID=29483 RepID=UPI0011A76F0A|nr:Rz1-like lysis system protein LysC [Yersinia aldovae]